MPPTARIIGSPLSPYVRKVLVCLQLKGIEAEIDPIVGFMGNDAFWELSPLHRVPVFIDDLVTLCDSSVICQYLEDRYPSPQLYPDDLALRAKARWLEEYADTRLGDVFIWRIFNQLVIKPFVFGAESDRAAVDRAISTDLPDALGYLERVLPDEGFACGELSIADVSIGALARNLAFVKQLPDAARFPKTAAYLARVHALDVFQKLVPAERALMRAPPSEHRRVLTELGVKLTDTSYANPVARAGIMPI